MGKMAKVGKMPKVIDCLVAACAFNQDRCCHARAITVGGPEPLCDTFAKSRDKGGDIACTGCVGACKVQSCGHNEALECTAEGIRVMPSGVEARCATFVHGGA
jgi:hypothetical protein